MTAKEMERKIWFLYEYNQRQLDEALHETDADHYESVLIGIISIMEFVEMIDMKKYEAMCAKVHEKAKQKRKEIRK